MGNMTSIDNVNVSSSNAYPCPAHQE